VQSEESQSCAARYVLWAAQFLFILLCGVALAYSAGSFQVETGYNLAAGINFSGFFAAPSAPSKRETDYAFCAKKYGSGDTAANQTIG
jgi:hypothetical protein